MTVTLNPLYRFETFVVGSANRLAVTAAKAVAESPGTVYNPLFIYAQPGPGQDPPAHGHRATRPVASIPGSSVEYLTLDEFVEAFHAAIAAGQGEAYRKRFLDVDLLLVDDVQFLTHRREMQAELLRLTDALQAANRQIVLTSDRPPAEIEALDERLIRRFAGGLVIDVAAPDYETRVAILRRKAEERRASFGAGVLEAVAGLAIDNVRELLGALNRLIAFQAVSDAPLTPEQARRLIVAWRTRRRPRRRRRRRRPRPAATALGRGRRVLRLPLRDLRHGRAAGGRLAHPGRGRGPALGRARDIAPAGSRRCWRRRSWTIPPAALAPVRGGRASGSARSRPKRWSSRPTRRSRRVPGPGRHRRRRRRSLKRAREGSHPPPAPSPLWRLDELVETAGNRMALQAALAVAKEPGTRYNPLVIVGASGSGKTHLLHAIGNALAGAVQAARWPASAPRSSPAS